MSQFLEHLAGLSLDFSGLAVFSLPGSEGARRDLTKHSQYDTQLHRKNSNYLTTRHYLSFLLVYLLPLYLFCRENDPAIAVARVNIKVSVVSFIYLSPFSASLGG